MKKSLLIIIIVLFSVSSDAQRRDDSDWIINIGFNAINNQQTQNPFFDPSNWALDIPISLSAERYISPGFYVEAAYSLNGFDGSNSTSDFRIFEEYTYHALDVHAKLYFGHEIFRRTDKIDPYITMGTGYFIIDDSKASFNVGTGILFWLNSDNTIGIRLQFLNKIALGEIKNPIDSNHYNYYLQAVFKL